MCAVLQPLTRYPHLYLCPHRAVQDLSVAAKQKQAQIMAIARQTAEQGIGDNDLKRLQRQFDSNKATFVNIDQKQRFMKGEGGVKAHIQHQQAATAGSASAAHMLLLLHAYDQSLFVNVLQACGTWTWTLTI